MIDSNYRLQSNEAEEKVMESDTYRMLLHKIDHGDTLDDEEKRELSQLVTDSFPRFSQFIASKRYSFNDNEYLLCILARLHAAPSSIAVLIGRSPAYVTKMGKALMSKLYGKEGDCKELKRRLEELM